MSVLTALNLGARQKELNKKVNDAIKNCMDFHQLNREPEETDVDKVFKIDIASKQKNINYLLEVLKSGDEFSIIRALNKCTWLCDFEFTKYINAECIKHDIFPFMSIKMKKIFLTKISMAMKTLQNENRLEDFYKLCLSENYINIASKFLCSTSESFKIDEAREQYARGVIPAEEKSFKQFIGTSFTIAQFYFENFSLLSNRNKLLWALRHMYSVSDEKYLELVENYYDISPECHETYRFGLRLSTNILTKHKDRVYENPAVYMNVLNPKVVTKRGTTDEAELYASSVLPDDVSSFWTYNYCDKYSFILNLVENNQKFSFIQKLFREKYPNEEFDMSIHFYNSKLFNLMTEDERREWALRHIASGQQLLGSENDYMWYKFLPFDTALEGIKKNILENTPADQRSDMFEMLIDSVKTQQHLAKLMTYYYDTEIVNQLNEDTQKFIKKLVEQNEVLKFDDCCWVALEKIFYTLGVFDTLNFQMTSTVYRVLALLYNIVQKKKVPDILNEFLNKGQIHFPTIMTYKNKINAEMMEEVYKYILNYYSIKIKDKSASTSSEHRRDLNKHLHCVLELMSAFKKKKDDIPQFINELLRVDWDKYRYHNLITPKNIIGEGDIIRSLKKNAAFIIRDFKDIKEYIDSRFGNINWLLKKLKTYFPNDIAKMFFSKLMTSLSASDLRESTVKVIVRGIITLADETEKVKFMEEYTPGRHEMAKEDRILNIQRAICMQVCYSRPPVPLPCVTPYITADMVTYCLPMFYNYSVTLPLPLFRQFVESLTNKPFSIEKHGLLLALKYFNAENLSSFISNTWNKTTDPSVRAFIFEAFINKFRKETEETQLKLFGTLIILTENLTEHEGKSHFHLIANTRLSDNMMGQFLIAAWKAFAKFSDNAANYQCMTTIIKMIERDICIISEDDLDNIISSHVEQMLKGKQILNNYEKDREDCINAKWDLTARNLCYVIEDKNLSKNLDLIKTIISECTTMWNEVKNGTYIIRLFCTQFFNNVESLSYDRDVNGYNNINVLYNAIILQLQASLPDHEIYMMIWNLRLGIETKKILIEESPRDTYEVDDVDQALAILIVNCIVKLAEGFGEVMKEYIEQNKYFTSLNKQIACILTNKVEHLKICLDRNGFIMISVTDMIILLCTGLMQFTLPDVYLFMVDILPTSYSDTYVDEFKSVVKTIQNNANEETKFYFYEKFVNNSFDNFVDTL